MLIWIILFFAVLIASFILALKSMGDYQDQPLGLGLKYSLFLIKNPTALNTSLLEEIYHESLKNNAIITLEKLFNGDKNALVIFAPKRLTDKLNTTLDLLELEDYSLKEVSNFHALEIGSKNLSPKILEQDFHFKLSELQEGEQLWWQIVLKPKVINRQCKNKEVYFQTVIRVILLTADKAKEQELDEILSTKGKDLGLIVLPQAYSGIELLKFYQQRILPLNYIKELGEEALPFITDKQIIALLNVRTHG
ncbi:MAG: hypothetical protein Q7R97_00875 [Candidatus Daviesbacteria bacterium]|nr:hypothetical protein [Candidatus Daviesbacteria bacterium]